MHRSLPKFDDTSYAHFITTRTYESRPYFKDSEFAHILLEGMRFYRRKHGFDLLGYVIMPDHFHLLFWWDKEVQPELGVSKIMQGIKGATARRIIDLARDRGLERTLQPTRRRSEGPHGQNLRYRLWQPGFHDFNVYSEQKLLEKLNYMHANPVKAGQVQLPGDYRWTSYWEYYGEDVPTGQWHLESETCLM